MVLLQLDMHTRPSEDGAPKLLHPLVEAFLSNLTFTLTTEESNKFRRIQSESPSDISRALLEFWYFYDSLWRCVEICTLHII